MKSSSLALLLLLAAGVALGTIAVRAKEPSYVAPVVGDVMPRRIEGEVPAGLALRTFHVEGICCPSCGSKLHRALASIEGIRKVAVDPDTKEVQVLVAPEVSSERLAEALTFDEFVARATPGTSPAPGTP